MQHIALYDPNRRPASWRQLIQADDYVVFLTDVDQAFELGIDGERLPAGVPSSCLLFGSLEEAECWCRAKVEETPALRCEIYDSKGKAKLPLRVVVNGRIAAGRSDSNQGGRRLIFWGVVSMLGSVPLFVWDWKTEGTLLVPTFLGINLIVLGLRLLSWGAGTLESNRGRWE